MGQSSPPSASTDSHHTLCEDRDMIRQGTRLCAAFAQLLAVLEQSKQNDDSVILLFRDVRNALFPSEAGAIDPLITNLFALSMQDGVCNKDILRIAGKANRALGRVRRASLDVLAEQSTGKEVREECSRLLEVVIGLYENVIRTVSELYSHIFYGLRLINGIDRFPSRFRLSNTHVGYNLRTFP